MTKYKRLFTFDFNKCFESGFVQEGYFPILSYDSWFAKHGDEFDNNFIDHYVEYVKDVDYKNKNINEKNF